ncbi:MAG: S41 family peptidase [Anaerolineae bacterium]|nr:S41 family peptidase [Chloroflexota bacterium]MBN8636878.1 S41 family peptidase [Anaerolineae bacterium]
MKLSSQLRGRWQHLSTAIILALVFTAGFAIGNGRGLTQAQGGDTTPPADVQRDFEPFWQVFNLIKSDYLDEIDTSVLVDGAISGMVDALEDQYSGYMNPEVYDLLNSDLEGEIEGIGVVIHTVEETGEIEVVGVLEGTPAQLAGMMNGDIFVTVDGQEVAGMNQTELAVLVRGPAGSTVDITVRRDDELLDFTVERAHIIIPNVEYEILDGNYGYVKLNQFTAEARHDLDNAFASIDVNNLNGLVLDFRDNPGGLLSSAIEIASAFVEEGTVVVEDFGDGNAQTFTANGDFAGITVPIVLLVNESSASASELVAGALQDSGAATIIGETTLGKGTVQTWHPLINGGGVRLTIARWLTPSGRWIHEQGIDPDITIEWTPESYNDPNDPQLAEALSFLQTQVAAPAQ